jgi:hypothetical protein
MSNSISHKIFARVVPKFKLKTSCLPQASPTIMPQSHL